MLTVKARYVQAIKAEKTARKNLSAAAGTATEAQYQRLSELLMAASAATDHAYAVWKNIK